MSTGLFQDEEESYNIEEVKYVLKGSAPSTDSSFNDDSSGVEDFSDFEDVADDVPVDDSGEGSDKPFDDEPFDADVDADEDADPEKYIQQLSGKLGQTLRQYTEDNGEPDFDLEKFAVNSVLSATHTSEMDSDDQRDIIKKVKNSGDSEDSGEDFESDDSDDEVESDESGAVDFESDEEEQVEEIVEELPLSTNPNHDDMLGMVTGCQPTNKPIDDDAMDILKDMTGLKESVKKGTFVNKNNLIKNLRLMENIEPAIQPITKPTTTPVKPMRETDRPFLPKRKDKVNPRPKASIGDVEFGGKLIDLNSLKIDGATSSDYPNFDNAFFSYAQFNDGVELSDIELQKFKDENSELLIELIFDGDLYK